MSYVLQTPNMYCTVSNCIRGRLNVSFELFSHGHSHLAAGNSALGGKGEFPFLSFSLVLMSNA
jgi:hypothetical protein